MRSFPFSRRGGGLAPPPEFAATEATMPPALTAFAPSADAFSAAGASTAHGGADTRASVPFDPATQPAPPDSLPAPPEAALVAQRPTLWQVGRYAVKGALGAGGLGQVWEAWDPLLSRAVAVKTLPLAAADDDREAAASRGTMFLREARAAARLSHRHIVTVHDAGLALQGMYLAMERLHGRDLRQALAAGWRPTPWQAARLVRRIADALAYAHARGVVHCDVKPSNIFLDRRARPKLLDFGIARFVRHGATVAPPPGVDGVVMGSPHYLAPEQLAHGSADERTDIRGLGLVLYELLAGRRAFDGDSVEAIAAAVLDGRLPTPAHRVRAGVPRTLSAIAARAMAHDPRARPASAAALAVELRAWSERHPPPPRGDAARMLSLAAMLAAIATARGAAARPWAPSTALAGPSPGEATAPLPRPAQENAAALPPSLRQRLRERRRRWHRRAAATALLLALPATLLAAAWLVHAG